MENFTVNNNAQFDNISISANSNSNKEVKNNPQDKIAPIPQIKDIAPAIPTNQN